jgi:magnesium transporter
MNEYLPFALTYVERHTESAARVLHGLPPEDTAALLEVIPHKTGVRIIEKLPPQYATQCILKLSLEKSAIYLRESTTLTGGGLLKLLPASFRRSSLKTMPDDKRGSLKKQMSYPGNAVGAWMELDSPSIPIAYSVGQVRQMLRAIKGEIDHSLCVVDKDGELEGLMQLSRLARSRAKHAIRKIVTRDIDPLSDKELLTEAFRNRDWGRFDAYPVLSSESKLVGLLTIKNLERGLRALGEHSTPSKAVQPPTNPAQAFMRAVRGGLRTFAGVFTRRGKPGESE